MRKIIRRDVKQKILLLLFAGVALGFSRSPKNYFKILKGIPAAWKEINKSRLYSAVREFYNDRLIDYKEDNDGNVQIILTKEGQKKALQFNFEEMEIKKPEKWDKKWRIVIFDIPEKKKKTREALRGKLKNIGFQELQKSVFVHPFECENEIDFIVEVFQIRSHVRLIRAESITNEEQIKLKFGIY